MPCALAGAFLGACLIGLSLPAWAGKVRLSPLSVELTPDQRAAAITLQNEADTPVSLQVRVVAWHQDVNAGVLLDPTTDIALSPAMVTLPPGATQLVRVVSRTSESRLERHYRVLIDELPDASEVSHDLVRVLTRYSLPVFLEPRLAGLPKLAVQLRACDDGRQRLVISNTGERRARLADWRLLAASGKQALAGGQGLTGYVLPGSALAIPLSAAVAAQAQGTQFSASTDLGPWQADVAPGEAMTCPQPPAAD